MAFSYPPYYPRRPRHPVVNSRTLHVELRRSAVEDAEPLPAVLVDISRNGFCVQMDRPLPREEAVVLHMRDATSGLNVTLPGVVRALRAECDDTWSIGCLALELLSWEVLGELFLNGILRTDDPPSSLD